MSELLKVKIEGLNELDIQELQKELRGGSIAFDERKNVSRKRRPPGTFGVPPELSVVLELVRDLAPYLIGVVAIFIAKRRTNISRKSVKLSWSKDGINYEKAEFAKSDSEATADQIKESQIKESLLSQLAGFLKEGGKNKDTPEKK